MSVRVINVRCTPELYAEAQEAARERGLHLSDLVRESLTAELGRREIGRRIRAVVDGDLSYSDGSGVLAARKALASLADELDPEHLAVQAWLERA